MLHILVSQFLGSIHSILGIIFRDFLAFQQFLHGIIVFTTDVADGNTGTFTLFMNNLDEFLTSFFG